MKVSEIQRQLNTSLTRARAMEGRRYQWQGVGTVQGKRMLTVVRRPSPRQPRRPGGLVTVDESHQKAPQTPPRGP